MITAIKNNFKFGFWILKAMFVWPFKLLQKLMRRW